MSITVSSNLFVAKVLGAKNQTPKVLLEERQSKQRVEVAGKILEAQYRVPDGFVVLLTEGNPFEEALYIYLLSAKLRVIDSLELSAMYAEAMLRNVSCSNTDELTFSFFDNDEKWVLKIFSTPRNLFFRHFFPVKGKLPLFHKSRLLLVRA